ncbi:MAG: long-chain acyl-CoA synthetase [Chloroflexota bacterium]|nr:long-chain acyl-CoA synthetase [Chloroflexota bacterium]
MKPTSTSGRKAAPAVPAKAAPAGTAKAAPTRPASNGASRPEGLGAPPPSEHSLAELVPAAAARDPEGIAAVAGRARITYADLDRAVASLADDLLDRGITPGRPIAVLAGTGIEFMVAAYAVLRAGAVLVPISPTAPAPEVTGLLRAARVEMVLTDVEHEEVAWAAAIGYHESCGAITLDLEAKRNKADRLALSVLTNGRRPGPPPRLRAGSPAVILFTSGSTARPKAVVHSHDGLFRNALAVAWEMTALTNRDVMLGALPLAHSFGLSGVMNASMLVGARIELLPRFDAKSAWKAIRNRGVTVATGVPTMFRRLVDDPDASRHTDLRLAVVSGSSCPRDLARDIRLRMGVHTVERYGMSEASPLAWRVVVDDAPEGDVGWPGWGVHFRAVNDGGKDLGRGKVGELEVQSPSMLLRYLAAEDNQSGFDHGWLRTGDLGMVREDGGVTLVARLKDIILRGGYSVAASEVERAVQAHPWVAEAVVIGIPDPTVGEEIAAAVVLKPRRSGKPAEWEVVMELERHMGERLAPWKRPRLWRVVEEVPRTPLGKIKRDLLRHLWDVAGTPTSPGPRSPAEPERPA